MNFDGTIRKISLPIDFLMGMSVGDQFWLHYDISRRISSRDVEPTLKNYWVVEGLEEKYRELICKPKPGEDDEA